MNERLHIHKKADPSASKSVHTQFQSRPNTAQEQPHSAPPQSQTKIDNQEFQQHKFEATKLEIQAKHGTITPQGQEQLTVLQAKMSNLLQRQVEHTSRFGHNAAKTAINCPDTPPPSSIQAKLNIGKPEESNQETFIEQKCPPPLQMQPLSRGRLPISPSLVQPKLTIGQPGDKYEQEADQAASQVVNQINAPVPQQSGQSQSVQREAVQEEDDELSMKPEISTIQREAVSEEEEELQTKPMLQLQPSGGGMAAAPDLEASIQQAQGSGQPLTDSIRQPMEQAFGADFSNVKVHTDTQSDQLNQSIQARAFTTGQDVFFRQGEYNPGSRGGQELLAHELTHVVQQSGGLVQRAATLPQMLGIDKQENTIQRNVENPTYKDIDQTNVERAKLFFKAYDEAVQKAYKYAIAVPSLGSYSQLNGYTQLWTQKWNDYLQHKQPKLMAATFGYVIESLVSDPRTEFSPKPPAGCSVNAQVTQGGTRPDLVLRLSKGSTHIAWLDLTASSSVDHIYTKDDWSSKVLNFAEVTYPSLNPSILAFMKQNRDNKGSLSEQEFNEKKEAAQKEHEERKAQWRVIGQKFTYKSLNKEIGISKVLQELKPEIRRQFIQKKLQDYFKTEEALEEKMVPSILVAMGVNPVSWNYITGYSTSENAGEAWLIDNPPPTYEAPRLGFIHQLNPQTS